jgi:nucleoside-diphosphate-sugar epimerase
MKKALVLGASGATGQLLVKILLEKGVEVTAIVRNANSLPNIDNAHQNLQIVEAEISKIPNNDLAQYLKECEVVLSCLGHNLTFKGMFAHPKQLVTDAITKVAKAIVSINANNKIKIILMNTTGNSNRDIPEKPPYFQRFVIFLLRLLLPPHLDNEKAADFLRLEVGQNNNRIEWVAVRPDGLVNEDQVSQFILIYSHCLLLKCKLLIPLFFRRSLSWNIIQFQKVVNLGIKVSLSGKKHPLN